MFIPCFCFLTKNLCHYYNGIHLMNKCTRTVRTKKCLYIEQLSFDIVSLFIVYWRTYWAFMIIIETKFIVFCNLTKLFKLLIFNRRFIEWVTWILVHKSTGYQCITKDQLVKYRYGISNVFCTEMILWKDEILRKVVY